MSILKLFSGPSPEKLEQKGLVTFIINKGKKEFRPSNPEVARDILKEKENKIDEAISELTSLYQQSSEEIVAEIYRGKQGAKFLFEDVLKEKKDYYALGASGKGVTTLPYYMPHFYKRVEEILLAE